MYVYIQSESNLWTVGFYDPSGKFIPEKDCDTPEEAVKRVSYLNGNKEMRELIKEVIREELVISVNEKSDPYSKNDYYRIELFLKEEKEPFSFEDFTVYR